MMSQSVSRSVVRRLLSVAAVLTLVGFAARVDQQPASALAAPGASADVGTSASYLEDDNKDNNDNHNNNDEHRNNNDDNRNNHDSNDNHNGNNGNTGNNGGQGIFSLICSVPGFANNVGCATGLLGN